MKRKFILLMMIFTLFGVNMSVLNAQIDLTKQYRLKVNDLGYAGMYLHVKSFDAPNNQPQVGIADRADNTSQIFTLEDAGNGNYYLKCARNDYYIKCAVGAQWWCVYAYSTTDKTPLYFDYTDETNFYLRDYDKMMGNGGTDANLVYKNYFKVENGGVYCDAAPDYNTGSSYNQNSSYVTTWSLEEVDCFVEVSANDTEIYDDETVQLSAIAAGGAGNYSYSWSPATGLDDATSATPIFTPTAVGTYTFTCTATDANGNTATSEEITITNKGERPATRNIVFELKDSYGDGWNGGYLTVVADDGTNQTLNLSSGSTATYTLPITAGANVTVTFTAGNYSGECSYTIAYEEGNNIYNSGYMTQDNGYSYSYGTTVSYSFTIETIEPSVTINLDPATITFGDVRMGDYWTDKEQKSAQIGVVVEYTTITNVSCDNELFVVEYNTNESVVNVGYNPESGVTGEQTGTITITSADCDPVTVTVTANAYTAVEPDAIEAYTTIEFANGEYSDTPIFAKLHDDYKLPGEVNEGETPDAVYKFTLVEDAVVTVNVTGTNGIAAIYNEFGENEGPSSNNNYEGVEGAPEVPTGPTTFFYDFNDGNLEDFILIDSDGDGYNWYTKDGGIDGLALTSQSYDGEGLNPDNYIYTREKYSITSDSKLYFKYFTSYYEKFGVEISTDGQNFINVWNIAIDADEVIDQEISLGEYAGQSVHIALRHYDCYDGYYLYIDNITLTDGSSKTRAGEPQINAVQYPAGTYYLVAAAEDRFTVSLSTATLPAPEAITLIAPENNALEQDNPKLIWSLGNYTSKYQLLLGTTNPPTDVVVDWTTTLANSYQTSELEVGTKYYWQVKAKNDKGSTESEVWSFVTPLNKPTELAATATNLYPGDETTISWTAAVGATGYNVYVNDVKVNEQPITETSYTLSNLEYNMNPGNAIAVTAVHALGESSKCEPVYVKVAGELTLVVNVKDAEGNAIEGAAVAFNTESYYDEYYQLVPAVETLYTDANGQITQVLLMPCMYGEPYWKYSQIEISVSKDYYNTK